MKISVFTFNELVLVIKNLIPFLDVWLLTLLTSHLSPLALCSITGKADKKTWVLLSLALVRDLNYASAFPLEGLLTQPNPLTIVSFSCSFKPFQDCGQPEMFTQPQFVSNQPFRILLLYMYGVISLHIQTKFWVGDLSCFFRLKTVYML